MTNEEIVVQVGDETKPVRTGEYPDGWPIVFAHGLGVRGPVNILVRPKGVGSFMAALFMVDSLRERVPGAYVRLVLPMAPGARQDRLNGSGDYLFTAKSVARAINDRRFSQVVVVDPHSDVMPALIDRCHVVRVADYLNVPQGKYAAVVSPDAGAERRAGAVAVKLGLPLLHGWKKRSVADGSLSGFGLEPSTLPAGSLVLVVDDICDGGGTFLGLADELDRAGLRAHLLVTHGLFTRGTDELLRRYQAHVYCTDSVVGEKPGVIVVKVCEKILRGEML